ncbi:hypothetical protein D3C79_972210 [compost metagenome]
MECANYVFGQRMVNSHLPAYAAIMSKNRRWYLYKFDSAHIGGCHKASEIAYYSAA